MRVLLMAAVLMGLYKYQASRFDQAEQILGDKPFKNELSPITQNEKENIIKSEPLKNHQAVKLKEQKTEPITIKSTPVETTSTIGPPKVKPGHVLFEVKMNNWVVTQGDILLGQLKEQNSIKVGQYKPNNPKLWPTSTIPYFVADDYPYVQLIEDVINYFNENTPIRFRAPKQGDKDGIVFRSGEEHCYSYLGRVGGFQPIFLGEECRGPQIIHEILHALGFVHEQSRTDRDEYVEILWDEIQPDFHLQFMQVPDSFMMVNKHTQFDYNSVMLYQPTAFAKSPGQIVMKSKTEEDISPTMDGLSEGDLQKLNQVYGR